MRHVFSLKAARRILVAILLAVPCIASFDGGFPTARAVGVAVRAVPGLPATSPAPGYRPGASTSGPTAELTAEDWERIGRHLREASYRIEAVPSRRADDAVTPPHEAVAFNRAQDLRASFGGSGTRFGPAGEGASSWDWRLTLSAFGYEGALDPAGAPEVWAQGNLLEYRRGDLTEWYVNDPRGIEHGFTLAAPPPGDRRDALVLKLRTTGRLGAQQESSSSIILTDGGAGVLRYSGLLAWDAAGRKLPAEMEPVADGIEIRVRDGGARYPLTVDPLITQIKKLTASDWVAFANFGTAVGISGDTVVVGSPDAGLSGGAAYVFERNQGGANNWGLVKKLTASDGAAGDWFGFAVAIAVDTIVVGAPEESSGAGAAYVFGRNQGGANTWGQVKKLTASDAAADDQFSFQAVAIAVDTIVVGAHQNDDAGTDSGAAYVFRRNEGGFDNWGQVKKLLPGDGAAGDLFGRSVATSGERAVVGSPWDDDAGTRSGSAYVFDSNLGGTNNWGQAKKLTANDATSSEDYGKSVAVAGDRIVVSAPFGDTPAGGSGKAYVHERHQGGTNVWGVVRQLIANDAAAGDVFGDSLSLSGDTVVVGAWFDDDAGSASGSAYVFQRNQGGTDNWGQVKKLTAGDAAEGEEFGSVVSVSGTTMVVGAPKHSEGGITRLGAAYVFGPGPPAATVPIAPSGTSPNAMPTYVWEANAATWYYLWIDGPSGNLLRQWYTAASVCSAGTCSVAPSLPLGLGVHNWWVRTWDDQGQGPWSPRTSFTVSSGPGTPGVPVLVGPRGSIGVRTPSYAWHEVPADAAADVTAADAATWYELWVNGPSGNIIQQWYTSAAVCSGSGCAITPAALLATGDHTWWVRGWNPQGNGAWSPGVAFTVPVSAGPPGKPALTAPTGSISDTTPTYTWERTDGSTWYRLWVDGPGGNVILQWYTAASVCVGNVCSITPTTVLGSGAHQWWVRSWNWDGNGPWSAREDFILP
jgi:hypothetical protein